MVVVLLAAVLPAVVPDSVVSSAVVAAEDVDAPAEVGAPAVVC